MLNIKEPRITRFIAHIVDPQTSRIRLSDLETPIGDGSGFPHEFFHRYIQLAVRDPNRRLACIAQPTAVVPKTVTDLLNNQLGFVEASRSIAKHLDKVIAGADSRYRDFIKVGDVMVALFEDESTNRSGRPAYVAVLKVNPSETVTRHAEIRNGKRLVVFESDDRVPEPAEDKVQKIALLSPQRIRTPEPHDVVILDYNLALRAVANFFYDDFLGTTLNRDADELTGDLLRSLPRLLQQTEKQIPLGVPEKLEILDRAHTALEERKYVTPAEFVGAALDQIAPADVIREIGESYAKKFDRDKRPHRQIKPNQKVRVNRARVAQAQKRTYQLDQGVQVSGTIAALDQLVEIDDHSDAQGRTVLTIRSQVFTIR